MRVYLAIKFKEDLSNKKLIEDIAEILERDGIETQVMVRDFENLGRKKYEPLELMKIAFGAIDRADVLLVEFSEKGVGLGIEAGYAYAKLKPVIVIAKVGSEISDTLRGIAQDIIFYNEPSDLANKIKI